MIGKVLTVEERSEIDRWWHARDRGLSDESLRSMARRLGRCPSVISREVRRNGSAQLGYHVIWAQKHADARRRRPKPARLTQPGPLRAQVLGWLGEGWSPQQVAGRLAREFPDRPEMQVSHETIYMAVYLQSRGGLKAELVKALRTGRTRRRPMAGRVPADARNRRVWAVPRIAERPEEISERLVPGHWEGDLVIGRGGRSAVVTLVERHSRFTLLGKLPAGCHDSPAVVSAIRERMLQLPTALRRTLTWDQGTEMARHAQLRLGDAFEVYFCDPHSPWQRGTNENTNGLIREYFPKGVTDFNVVEQDYLDLVAAKLNARPRAILNFMTPSEALNAALVASTD